jgi:hypothetical protein
MQLPAQAARQLPDQSTTFRVDSSSTDDSRLRGALPSADQVHRSKQRAYWMAFPPFTIRGTRIVKVEPRPISLSTVMSPPII